ncbi:MAG: GAF domain-containing protein [Hormoscilla sp.]
MNSKLATEVGGTQSGVTSYQIDDWDESQKALAGVIARVRESLDLETIFNTTVTEVRQLLKSDRVGVLQFSPELGWRGQLVSEDVQSPWKQAMDIKVQDHCFGERFGPLYRQGRISAIYDIYKKGLRDCHVTILEQFQVRANLVAPLLKQGDLWGLLCVHQCSGPRLWKMPEIEFTSQIAQHLGVALQHVDLLDKALYQARQQKALASVIGRIRQSLDLDQIFNTTVTEMRQLLNVDRVGVFQFYPELDWEGELVYEDVAPYWKSGMAIKVKDHCFGEHFASLYQRGRVSAIADIYQGGLQSCHVQTLEKFQVRANLVAPLIKGEQLWGLLCVHQGTPRNWDESDTEFVRQIAEHLGVALQQADYLQQVQLQATQLAKAAEREKAAQREKTLATIVDKIRQSLDINIVFQTATQEVQQLLEVDRSAIMRFLPSGNREFVAQSIAEGSISLVETQLVISGPRETAVVEDIYHAGLSDSHIAQLEQLQAKAYIKVPILQGEKIWGLLAVYQNSGPRAWQGYEVDLLGQISTQLGVALQKSEYIKQVEAQSAELAIAAAREKAALRQQTIAITIEKIRRSLDLDIIFQTTALEVKQLLQADRVIIYQFNSDWSGKFLFEVVADGWTPLMQKQLSQPELGRNVSACSLQNLAQAEIADSYLQDTQGGKFSLGERVRACDDIYNAGFTDCYLQVLEELEAKAYVIAGIYQNEKLWGLLAVYQNSDSRHWQPEEIGLLAQISMQLGVALQQGELLQQTRQQAAELAQALQDLQQAQTQLIQSEKMSSLGQLVAGIAHEINNPVNFIYGNLTHVNQYAGDLLELLHLYQEHYPDPASEVQDLAEEIDRDFLMEDLSKILNSMKMGAERIRQIVLSLRTFSRLDESDMKAVDIHDGIDSTLVILQHKFQTESDDTARIELVKEYGTLPLVECYAAQLNQVFMNILSNALDALAENPEDNQTIQISTERVNDFVVIRIADNGPGIPEDVRSQIFNPFFTTKPVGKGTGLGLSLSYKIVVEQHKGKLDCISQPSEGTSLIIKIPIKQ